MNRKQYAIAVSFSISLLAVALVPLSGQQGSSYDPWLDYNDDGILDIHDLQALAYLYGTSGEPLDAKAALAYDSGWLNITSAVGQSIQTTHNLNIADWNNPNLIVDVTGKTTVDGELLRLGAGGWNRIYGGTEGEGASSLIQTSYGAYVVAGYTKSYGAGLDDFWLIGTDETGEMLWNMTYGGYEIDRGQSVVETSDGGYAVAGYTESFGSGSRDFWLIGTDSTGNELWNQTYGGLYNDVATSLIQPADAIYAIAGYTESYGAGGYDFWLIKTNGEGIALWNKTYGGTDNDYLASLIQTSDAGYALAGSTQSFNAGGDYDFWLVKTDADGNELWNQTYGGLGSDEYAFSVVETSDGGYAMVGIHGGNILLVKTDGGGNMQWQREHSEGGHAEAHSLVETSDGGYATAGWTDSLGYPCSWLAKTDSEGNMMWSHTYGHYPFTYDSGVYSLIQTDDERYVMAGYILQLPLVADLWLIKTGVDDAHARFHTSGLTWTDSTPNTLIFYRGESDVFWNYLRVRIWRVRETP